MIRKIIILCSVLCILLFAGCANNSTNSENEMKMSNILTENSEHIDFIAVYQAGMCQEISVGEIPDDIEDIFKTISRKQKRMNGVDGALDMSVEEAQQCLLSTTSISPGFLEIENQYVLVELKNTYTFVLNHRYMIECDVILIDAENKLVHWGRTGEFLGCVGYFR